MTNIDRAKAFLRAIEAREDTTVFLAPDIVQREFPNQFVPGGATRDLAALKQAAERGKGAVTRESYQIVNAVEHGAEVALAVIWTGTRARRLRRR